MKTENLFSAKVARRIVNTGNEVIAVLFNRIAEEIKSSVEFLQDEVTIVISHEYDETLVDICVDKLRALGYTVNTSTNGVSRLLTIEW